MQLGRKAENRYESGRLESEGIFYGGQRMQLEHIRRCSSLVALHMSYMQHNHDARPRRPPRGRPDSNNDIVRPLWTSYIEKIQTI